MPAKGRDNKRYADLSQALRRRARRDNEPCWICGRPIDFDADWRDPLSFTADHVVPIALGGSMRGEMRPCHRSCNSRRSTRDATPERRLVTSMEW